MFDDLECALIHALHIDGRAPFSRIAAALDVSPRTVARLPAAIRCCCATFPAPATSPRSAPGMTISHTRQRCGPWGTGTPHTVSKGPRPGKMRRQPPVAPGRVAAHDEQ